MRPAPRRIERLPEQYFTGLLARVAAAATAEGEPLVDLGRGNPEVGPPEHVVEALVESARRQDVHGYAPFAGLPALKEAVAERYASVYAVHVDPNSEIAIVPGTKTALCEVALVAAERGTTILLPDPGYPDYFSAVALADARLESLPLDDLGQPVWQAVDGGDTSLVYLNYPSNPTAAVADAQVFDEAVEFARRHDALVLHDFAYGDLVYGGRAARSFLAAEGAKEVGVELFSMSKSYGMAGWRIGFVVGNAEIVRRIELYQDHVRAGIFMPLQHAAIAALRGPQDSVEARRRAYEGRRDRVLDALGGRCDGTFFAWLRLPETMTVERLLNEQRVALAPGEGFGARGAGCARLSLAVSDETLARGLERLQAAFG